MAEKYFIYEPGYNGVNFFPNRVAWEKAIEEFDFLGKYCDDGWSDEVNHIIAGILPDGVVFVEDIDDESEFYEQYATHEAVEDIREYIDENGYGKESGEYWGKDFTHIADYSFQKHTMEPLK